MKFLLDTHWQRVSNLVQQYPDICVGQLMTPINRLRKCYSPFAIDNCAYSNFAGVEHRWWQMMGAIAAHDNCLFVSIPDVVADHAATLALWEEYSPQLPGIRKAFVLQDGCDQIPDGAAAVFLGGSTGFKMSGAAAELVRFAQNRGMYVHVGRVNTPARFLHFKALKADSCDGTGVLRFPHMLPAIAKAVRAAQFWERDFG